MRVPCHGDLATCTTCGGEIEFFEESQFNGVEEETINSWWSHSEHPADDHEAIPGPCEHEWGDAGECVNGCGDDRCSVSCVLCGETENYCEDN